MVAVLLLNASYEPLAVIPKQQALSLLARGRVEAVTDEMHQVGGVSRVFTIPTVLRLRRYVNVPMRGARWSRRAIFHRDGYRCIYCGMKMGDKRKGMALRREDFTLDHVIPRSRGGKNSWGNTACACAPCNQRKGNRTPHEAGMSMLWEPKTPRVDYLVASGEVPEAWKFYLQV